MSKELQLTIDGPLESPSIALTPASHEARRMVLQACESVTDITCPADAKQAAEVFASVKGLLKTLEASRKTVKEPILAAGREVDRVAKEFASDLEKQSKRLSLMVGAHQENERRKAEAAAAEARRKEEQLKAELADKERRRIAAESQGRTGTLEQDIETLRDEAVEKIAETRAEAAQAADLQSGVSVRKVWKFEVEDIYYLFKEKPDLCLIEPNKPAIRAFLKAFNGQPVAGLRIWSETPAITRSTAPSALPSNPEQYDY